MAELASFELSTLAEKTIRFSISDLENILGPVIADATISINLYDEDDVLVTTGVVQQKDSPDNDTYYADITMPDVTRTKLYYVKARGEKDDAVYTALGEVWVHPF